MKNLAKFCGIILLAFMFTSCVDYVQSISYKDGNYHLYYKVTFSKLIFGLLDEDPEDLFEDFDEDMIENLPDNVECNSINNDFEVGAEFSIDINPKTTDEDERDLLPKVSGNKCFIPFLLGENNTASDSFGSDDSMGEAISQAILSSAKCRIFIGKNLIPEIETAYIEGLGELNYIIPFYDYGDSFCLEIPFVVIMEDSFYKTDKIVIVKG